jgi:hypothetical protein
MFDYRLLHAMTYLHPTPDGRPLEAFRYGPPWWGRPDGACSGWDRFGPAWRRRDEGGFRRRWFPWLTRPWRVLWRV